MELKQALEQIGDIRMQMARTRVFHGYRAPTTLLTAAAAIGAALWQQFFLPDAAAQPMRFVNLWVIVALGCVAVVAAEMTFRYRQSNSTLERELTLSAMEQFLPSMVVSGLLTIALCDFDKPLPWLLPGLWQILFGLGIIASRRLLARPIFLAGIFYVFCGLFNLVLAQTGNAFSPWLMAGPFAIGQTAIAIILHQTQEPSHAG